MLVGNVVALLSPLVFIPLLTYVPPLKPQGYDWVSMALISKGDDSDAEHGVDPERADGNSPQHGSLSQPAEEIEKKQGAEATMAPTAQDTALTAEARHEPLDRVETTASFAEDRKKLDRAAKWARFLCVALALCFVVLWPMPLFGTGYIFSRPFFTGWTVVGIIWLFCSAGIVVCLPLWQSRMTIAQTTMGVVADVTGKGRKSKMSK